MGNCVAHTSSRLDAPQPAAPRASAHVDDALQPASQFASVLGRSSAQPRMRDGRSRPRTGASHCEPLPTCARRPASDAGATGWRECRARARLATPAPPRSAPLRRGFPRTLRDHRPCAFRIFQRRIVRWLTCDGEPGPRRSQAARARRRAARRRDRRQARRLELDGLIEAAEGRTERLFWTVSDLHQYPGPSSTARWRARGFTGRCARPSPVAGSRRCPSD